MIKIVASKEKISVTVVSVGEKRPLKYNFLQHDFRDRLCSNKDRSFKFQLNTVMHYLPRYHDRRSVDEVDKKRWGIAHTYTYFNPLPGIKLFNEKNAVINFDVEARLLI